MKQITAVAVLLLAVASAAFIGGGSSVSLSDADRDAITQVALDYIDGFYEGSGVRMKRALHPDLAKRNIVTDRSTRTEVVRNMTAEQLIEVTGQGFGERIAKKDGRRSDVTILDVFGEVASVRIDAMTWIDYLHVAKVDEEWKIINVLWEWRPEEN